MSDDITSFDSVLKYLQERAVTISKYSDKLRESLKKLDEQLDTLDIGITVEDTAPVFSDTVGSWFMRLDNDGLWFVTHDFDLYDEHREPHLNDPDVRTIANASRDLLIAAFKRLPVFLQVVAEKADVKATDLDRVFTGQMRSGQ